jgi:hypothetical protein
MAVIEIYCNAVSTYQSILTDDGLLATNGSSEPAIHLIRDAGADRAGLSFLVELDLQV